MLYLSLLQHNMTLLDDDSSTVEEASIEDNQQVLVEGRYAKYGDWLLKIY